MRFSFGLIALLAKELYLRSMYIMRYQVGTTFVGFGQVGVGK